MESEEITEEENEKKLFHKVLMTMMHEWVKCG